MAPGLITIKRRAIAFGIQSNSKDHLEVFCVGAQLDGWGAVQGQKLRDAAAVGGSWRRYLQWTLIGPSWPNCSLVLCTWPMKSMKPSPDLGTPCSGQSVNWNWRTVRDWPSWGKEGGEKKGEMKDVLCVVIASGLLKDCILVPLAGGREPSPSRCVTITVIWSWISCNGCIAAVSSVCLTLSATQRAITSFLFCAAFLTPSLTEINRASGCVESGHSRLARMCIASLTCLLPHGGNLESAHERSNLGLLLSINPDRL